jgi:hypothetical protein
MMLTSLELIRIVGNKVIVEITTAICFECVHWETVEELHGRL